MIRPVCPHDQIDLARRVNGGVGQYYCTSCMGFVVGFGALKRVLDPRVVSHYFRETKSAPVGTTPCTHCRKPMNVLLHSTEIRDVELDYCKRCDLLWFDTGEWHDLEGNKRMRDRNGRDEVGRKYYREYAEALLALEEEGRKTKKMYTVEEADAPYYKLALVMLGVPCEEESDRFRTQPLITWGLIFLCVVISMMGFRNMEFALTHFAHRGSDPFPLSIFTGVASFFLHGGWMHLIMNMYFFWIFGDNCEDHLGKWRYVVLLLAATLFGDLMVDWLDPRSGEMPGVGASGGIAGLISFYLLRFPHRRFLVRFWFRPFAVPSLFFGLFYFFQEFMGAFVQMAGSTSTSHLAHLGGAAMGVLFALIYRERWDSSGEPPRGGRTS